MTGTVVVSATASDDVGVVGVQFLLDGAPLLAEDTSAPYSIQWNTISTLNGPHQLSARARDTGGNLATSQSIGVTVSNTGAPGAVAFYAFDELTGITAIDSSGSLNNGTIAGAARVPGKYASGLSFNGTSDMVSIPGTPSLNLTTGMTQMVWVNPSLLSGYQTVILKEIPGDFAWAIDANDGSDRPGVWITVGSTVASAKGAAKLPLNTWTHLAGTYDGAVLRFFVNGVQVSTRNISGPMPTASNALRIGGNSIWGEYFAGVIDEVRVYNRALTQTEIQQGMNSAIAQ